MLWAYVSKPLPLPPRGSGSTALTRIIGKNDVIAARELNMQARRIIRARRDSPYAETPIERAASVAKAALHSAVALRLIRPTDSAPIPLVAAFAVSKANQACSARCLFSKSMKTRDFIISAALQAPGDQNSVALVLTCVAARRTHAHYFFPLFF